MRNNVGYGTLSGNEDEGSYPSAPIQRHPTYGSFQENNDDSYNQWYIEGFGNEYDPGYDSTTASALHRALIQQNPDFNSDFYESYGTDPQGAVGTSRHQEGVDESYNENNGLASTPLVVWNLINLLLSTSLLAFPFVVKEAGYITLPLIVVLGIVLSYTSQILIGMMYERSPSYGNLKVRVRKDYCELGRQVFNSEKGAVFIQVVQVIEMLCICILNICVLGQLGEEITNYNVQICTAIAALFALPTFFIRKLVIIGWLQTIGVISLTIGLLLVQGWCIAHAEDLNPRNIPIAQLEKIPVAIGVIIYAFGIQGVLPGMEEQMRRPKQFGNMINWTFCLVCLIQCLFGLTNAMYYGEKTAQVIVIDLSDHFELGITSACFIAISILSHFSLPTFVVMDNLDKAIITFSNCCPTREHTLRTVSMVLLRIFVMGLSLAVALVLPYFAYLMAFIGSSITVLVSLILPCAFHLKLRYLSMQWYQKMTDIIIIIFAVFFIVTGTYFSFKSMQYDMVNHTYT